MFGLLFFSISTMPVLELSSYYCETFKPIPVQPKIGDFESVNKPASFSHPDCFKLMMLMCV